MLGGDQEEAIDYGRRALDLATELDLPEVRVHALNNVGSARARTGDLGGLADLEASAALAEEINSPELARSLNNLGSIHMSLGNVRKCRDIELRALATAERFGLGSMLLFTRANILSSLYRLGEWDELMEQAEALLADSPPAAAADNARLTRALVRVARGDLLGAREDSGAAIEVARQVNEPQTTFPALAIHSYVLHALGEDDEARNFTLELLGEIRQHGAGVPFAALGEMVNCWLEIVDADMVAGVIDGAGGRIETPWRTAARALVAGELEAALDVYRTAETVPDVALLHRLIAERAVQQGRPAEAAGHLGEALAIYRSLGATRCIQQAERLLPASA
jgi:tetratricopeptide (TPR) repeat protein